MIDLEIAAVQVDILDREPGALPCPETGMQEDQKQVAVAAAVGILLHEFQEGGLLLRGEGLTLFFWLPLEEAQPEGEGVPAGGAFFHGIFEHRGEEGMVVADGFVGETTLLQAGEIELAIPHRDILCLTAPEVIRLQVGDGIAVAAAGTLPQVGAQQHVAFHQLAHGGAAPGGKAAQQPLAGDLVLLLPEGLQCGGIAGAALAALTPAELVAAIGALAFSGAQHAAAGVLAFFGFLYFLHTH